MKGGTGTTRGRLTLLLLLTGLFQAGWSQLSPGDLSQAHAHLEGLSNCTQCHVLRKKVSNENCLHCHEEIAVRVASGKGYHASDEIKGKECASCHNDHHGRDFQLVRFDTGTFGHEKTGFALQEAHTKPGCAECHKKDFIADPALREKSFTYLGLSRDCKTCHEDRHQGSLGTECASCHNERSFRPATGFSHERSAFPLKGKHSAVTCSSCHPAVRSNGKETVRYKGIAHGACIDCHRDVHENRFGTDCSRCHSESGFREIRQTAGFRHEETGYLLKGKHATLKCNACHKKDYVTPVAHQTCTDCHSDYHNGQFASTVRAGATGKAGDCAGCHNETGFSPSLYPLERHQESSFVLGQAHLATPCFECHKKGDRWEFRNIGRSCTDCHENVHLGFMDPTYDPGNACTGCHSETRWNEVRFEHSRTGYVLEGAHANRSCRECHFRPVAGGEIRQQFRESTPDCLNCHKDNHNGQFEAGAASCQRCHDFFDWKAGLFDHSRTRFPLDGKHVEVACAKCHPRITEDGREYTQYKTNAIACESCH
ncbi:MAG: cytochrome C [Bacteroidales bacterium]